MVESLLEWLTKRSQEFYKPIDVHPLCDKCYRREYFCYKHVKYDESVREA